MLTFPSALATFWRIPLTAPCWTKTFTPRFSNNQIILVWNVSKNICYQGYPVHELSFLIFYAIPIFFLTFFYTCMINTIRRANTGIRRSAYRGNNTNSKPPDHRKQTIRMLGECSLGYLAVTIIYNENIFIGTKIFFSWLITAKTIYVKFRKLSLTSFKKIWALWSVFTRIM